MDGAVLGVDGDQFGPRSLPQRLDDRAGGDEALLVRQGEAATGGQRGQRDGQTGEADDTVHDHVGVGDEVSQLRYDLGERQRLGDLGP